MGDLEKNSVPLVVETRADLPQGVVTISPEGPSRRPLAARSSAGHFVLHRSGGKAVTAQIAEGDELVLTIERDGLTLRPWGRRLRLAGLDRELTMRLESRLSLVARGEAGEVAGRLDKVGRKLDPQFEIMVGSELSLREATILVLAIHYGVGACFGRPWKMV